MPRGRLPRDRLPEDEEGCEEPWLEPETLKDTFEDEPELTLCSAECGPPAPPPPAGRFFLLRFDFPPPFRPPLLEDDTGLFTDTGSWSGAAATAR